MPRIDHVALWVHDLDAMCAFYARAFDGQVGSLYTNAAKGFASRFVAFGDGGRIEFMTTSTLAPLAAAPGSQRMGLTHLAMAVGSEARVDALTKDLQRQGAPLLDGPRRTGDGYYESVVLDPEGNRIEITV
ncbi:VOC family protein [Pseudacidovorax sp. RU35E]|uniref:VOC family protein n=1 Tax=Pseudacidovorax sp. RU35E TaxID=1907403 RepID=UPI000957384B|nr:VOC family protein [Pseudacidovorax sp. RU35E]SIR64770.1 lactoylglutathione lyase [Pseudacidovorax sp. RU35E]